MPLRAIVRDPVLLAPPLEPFLNRRLPDGQFGWERSSATQTDTIGGISLAYQRRRAHEGVDLEGKVRDPVFAVTDGIVVESGADPGNSKGPAWVVIDHHPSLLGHISVYYHLSDGIAEGEKVSEGQLIGFIGKHSSGAHLHFEIRHMIDPGASPSSDRGSVPLNPSLFLHGYGFDDDDAVETAAKKIAELRVHQHSDLELPYLKVRLQGLDDSFFLPLEHPDVDQLQVAAHLRMAFASGSSVRIRSVASTWHAGRRIVRGVRVPG